MAPLVLFATTAPAWLVAPLLRRFRLRRLAEGDHLIIRFGLFALRAMGRGFASDVDRTALPTTGVATSDATIMPIPDVQIEHPSTDLYRLSSHRQEPRRHAQGSRERSYEYAATRS